MGSNMSYRDKAQVELDVRRLDLNKAAAAKLNKRIGKLLHANKELHYYQGFHDIAQHTVSYKQLEQLAFNHLRDFMASDFEPTMKMLKLVPELLIAADPEGFGQQLEENSETPEMLCQGLFALSPLITMFSHTVTDPEVITQIINKVLRHGIGYVIYLHAALCLANKDALLSFDEVEEENGLSKDRLYSQLSQIGEQLNADNYTDLDTQARTLREKHPLAELKAFKSLSQYSVLKTGTLTQRSTVMFSVKHVSKHNNGFNAKHLLHGSTVLVLAAFGVLTISAVYSRLRSR